MRSTTKRPDLRRPALAAGGLAAAALLALLMLREPGAVSPPAPVPPPPPPAPIPPAPVQPPAPAPSADGLRLFGLLGRGAVIASADGGQSFFGIGREVRPGLRVARIAQDHVVLASDGGEVRLGFDGARPAEAAAPAATPAVATAGAGSQRDEALAYRFGLAARRTDGRITGYALRPGANLPLLQRAGLRPGDVIISVNGQHFDSDEKVLELPSEIAGSFTAEFEFERGGRRMRAALDVNPRT